MSTHLVSNETNEDESVWCGADIYHEYEVARAAGAPHAWPTRDPEKCDCKECLHALMSYAARAGRQLVKLWGGTP